MRHAYTDSKLDTMANAGRTCEKQHRLVLFDEQVQQKLPLRLLRS